jgi:RNA polymerase sigma-70 factor (ECF subfamily)
VAAVLTTHDVARLHREAGAGRWSLSVPSWRAALERSASHAGATADATSLRTYLEALHLEDLALAAACIEGLDPAWEYFIARYRPVLLRAADAIDAGGGARELADALFGELYGLADEHGRKSLLRYFHGRSSLATWLRAVLAQRHVDRLRSLRRLEPLPDEPIERSSPEPVETAAERTGFVALMRHAVGRAVAALAPRDRLRLSCYYAQNLRLNQIGRLLGEHEATVSRHLARTRRTIRDDVERQLADDAGLDPPTIAQCFEAVVEDAGPLDLGEWLGERKSVAAGRSKE